MKNKINHARILNAYLSRLTKAHLESIVKAENRWLDAAMNQGNSAQIAANAGFYAAVAQAVDAMLKYDLNIIEDVINQEVTV